MVPIHGNTMILFLKWIETQDLQIRDFKKISDQEIDDLVEAFYITYLPDHSPHLDKWRDSLKDFDIIYRDQIPPFNKKRFIGRRRNILSHYLSTPIHSIILFSREDEEIYNYLMRNIVELDGMSGNKCNVYVSLEQIREEETGTDLLELISNIFDIRIRFPDMPGILFWDSKESYFCSLRGINRDRLHYLFRELFEAIKRCENPNVTNLRMAYTNFQEGRIR